MDLLVLFPWERYRAGTLTNLAATPFVHAIATLIEKKSNENEIQP